MVQKTKTYGKDKNSKTGSKKAPKKQDKALRKGESYRSYDGMYIYTYIDPYTRKRKYLYSKKLTKLREKVKELNVDIENGIDVEKANKLTLNDLVDNYLAIRVDLRMSSYQNYVYKYNKYIRDSIGKEKIRDLSYSRIQAFYNHLVADFQTGESVLKLIDAILKPAFDLAIREDLILKNPTKGALKIALKVCPDKSRPREALSEEEQILFLKYIQNSRRFFRWGPFFMVMLGTGCRVSELAGLRWQDVDFENHCFYVQRALSYSHKNRKDSHYTLQINDPKSETSMRVIEMMPLVAEAFRLEKQYQKEFGSKNTNRVDGMTDFVFSSPRGKMLQDQLVCYAINNIKKAYERDELLNAELEQREPHLFPHFTAHSFRTTFTTRLCENETNLKVIQETLGHANITTTLNVYAKGTKEKKIESMNRLSQIECYKKENFF